MQETGILFVVAHGDLDGVEAAPRDARHADVPRAPRLAGEPGDESLRSTHGFDDERTGDERADADDLDHVESDGFLQTQAAFELRLRRGRALGWRGLSHAQRE